MKLFELYRRMADAIDERRRIIDIITDMAGKHENERVNQVAQIFQTFKYRDDRDGWVQGIPFSTNPDEINMVLQQVTNQGDALATKRLLRKILELTDG